MTQYFVVVLFILFLTGMYECGRSAGKCERRGGQFYFGQCFSKEKP